MKFKSDENLPVEVIGLLRQDGHDALSVVDQQLGGHPDVDVAVLSAAGADGKANRKKAKVTLSSASSSQQKLRPDEVMP